MKKIALCFIISYNHKLNKEKIWKDWIEPNKDIINVYFHYKNIHLIQSQWIKEHSIPEKNIATTTYYHVVPAYISILSYAFSNDIDNKWFCLLTESCVPIISPEHFRRIFFSHYYASLIAWKPAYWNIFIHQRANLRLLHKDYHLANDPWFTLTRDHVHKCILFMVKKNDIYQKVCKGGLANESIFANVLQTFNELSNSFTVINTRSTITDWTRMSNATSPYVFKMNKKEILEQDQQFIYNELKKNKFALFLRKVSSDYPNEILLDFIYNTNFEHKYISITDNASNSIYKKNFSFSFYFCLFIEQILLIGSISCFIIYCFVLYNTYMLYLSMPEE